MSDIKSFYHRVRAALGDFLWLLRRGHFRWLLFFVRHRARYRLDALWAGRKRNAAGGEGELFNFRRSIHRLEKGLSQRPLRNVFAEDYIEETVQSLLNLKQADFCDENTITWGQAVLDEYFKLCEKTERIARAFAQYGQITRNAEKSGWHPYPAGLRPALSIRFEDLHQLALRRRSVRHFLDRPVEPETVRQAMSVAILSPSACNRQSFRFLFFNERDTVRRLCEVPGGFAGFFAPAIVVVIGRYRGYFDERDFNVPSVDASLASMAFLFALETLDLSSVCINWPSLPERDAGIRKIIHLDDDEFVVMLIGIGYADPEGKVPYSAKKPVEEMLRCNERILRKNS